MDGHRHTEDAVDHRHVFDGPTAAEFVELEGEVLAGLVTDGISVLAELCGQRGVDVRRLLDLGCGPGVGTCALAEAFGSASVVAVDGSATMLEHVTARAGRLGLARQVETRQVELPAGLETLGRADVAWASMVLHHLGDEAGALRRIRGLLRPGGLLAVVEQAGPIRVVSRSTDVGRPGMWERLDFAWTAWLTEMRADLPGATPSPGLPAALEEAGFELVADEALEIVLDPPLDVPAFHFAKATLERTRAQLGPYVDAADLRALDVLIDDDVLRSEDTMLRASRRLTVAAVPTSAGGRGQRAVINQPVDNAHRTVVPCSQPNG
jgi:SAM-dependent methyltransferase